MSTEGRNPRSIGLDKMSAREIVRLMNEEEMMVMRVLAAAEAQLAEAAEHVAKTFMNGGRVIYVGAGTSGRVAMTDASEMPPTFGVEPDRFVAVVAGGHDALFEAVEGAEDDEHSAVAALNELKLEKRDTVIGIAASGRTAFVTAALRHAQQKGVWTCAIVNNRSAPLLTHADLPIVLETGPEVLTGSTRLKAGTSQKLALNRISTAAMVLSGKVVENLMVDVMASNQKLRERCVKIVRELSTATEEEARNALEQNGWSIRKVLNILRESVPKPSAW
jgi:N-acetylmuramic acid 6-phosphate etherase